MENNPTHTITIVEPIDMVAELKKEIQSKETIIVTCHLSSIEHIHESMWKEHERNVHDFKECLRIAETCKDIGLYELSGEILKAIEVNHVDEYRNHLSGGKTDNSCADGDSDAR